MSVEITLYLCGSKYRAIKIYVEYLVILKNNPNKLNGIKNVTMV